MGCKGKGEGGGSRPYARRSKNPVQGDGKKYAKKKGLPRFPGGKVQMRQVQNCDSTAWPPGLPSPGQLLAPSMAVGGEGGVATASYALRQPCPTGSCYRLKCLQGEAASDAQDMEVTARKWAINGFASGPAAVMPGLVPRHASQS